LTRSWQGAFPACHGFFSNNTHPSLLDKDEKMKNPPPIQHPEPAPPDRQKCRSGAQPGNHNGHKYELYSKIQLLGDQEILEGTPENSLVAELTLARSRLKNALERMEAVTDESLKIAWDDAGHRWFESILKIKMDPARRAFLANEIWDSFMGAIQAANDHQGMR
jgi:hypothetical protein